MKRFVSLLLIFSLASLCLLVGGCSDSSTSGSKRASIEHYSNYDIIEYRGKLEKLVKDDRSLLNDFLDGDVDGNKRVTAIYCKDYKLEWHRFGSGGTVDILDDNCTFFEDGLREYNQNTAGNPYDRLRNDFIFTITDQTDDVYHTYHFQSLDDVSKWLKQEF